MTGGRPMKNFGQAGGAQRAATVRAAVRARADCRAARAGGGRRRAAVRGRGDRHRHRPQAGGEPPVGALLGGGPSGQALRNRSAETIEDVSANVAGFSVQNLGPGQSQIAMRGVSAGQVVRDQPGVKEQVGVYP